jgi:2-iminoacetate synthase ThiH
LICGNTTCLYCAFYNNYRQKVNAVAAFSAE